MFLEAVLFSFAVGWLRGGRLKDDFGLRHIWLAPVAFMLQVLNRMMPPVVQTPITMFSYALLLYFVWENFRNIGVRFIGVGMLFNLAVMIANRGRMPVRLETASALGIDVSDFAQGVLAKHMPMTAASRLPFLADVIPIPWPLTRVISLGDIFVVIGAFLLVQHIMGKRLDDLRPEESAS